MHTRQDRFGDRVGSNTRYSAPAAAPQYSAPPASYAPQQNRATPFDNSYSAPMAEANPGNRTAARGTGGLQNCNNTIGVMPSSLCVNLSFPNQDVPSVKLHAAPGGTSSLGFGDATAEVSRLE